MEYRVTRRKVGSFAFAMLLVETMLTGLSVSAGVGAPAPEFSGQEWINSKPLRLADLKGKVVLVEFWTFSCFNCRNMEPHVKAWRQKYADKGLAVIGVHTPESDFEHSVKNVQHYIQKQKISYPVVTDNEFATWTSYGARAWPSVYLIDKQGVIRYAHVGEGRYAQTEQQIQALLAE